MSLSQLKAPKGAHRKKTRVGRGQASGLGKTAGRGGKGQKARSGNMHFKGFEGGQMPLQRRLPKFGFKNIHRPEFEEVKVGDLQGLTGLVDPAALKAAGLVRGLAGCPAPHRVVVAGLGLKKLNSTKILPDTPQTHGMIAKVSYLVTWEKVDAAPPAGRKAKKAAAAKA